MATAKSTTRRARMPNAKDFFDENFKRLGPNAHATDPEKFNLYAGLATLAEELEWVRSQLQYIRTKLDS